MSLANTLAGFNNLGALTVTGPNNYAGQTGVYTASNGLNFAKFDSVQSSKNAVSSWLGNNTGSNPNTSYTTIGEAGAAYTGSPNGGSQWANILGVSPDTAISSVSKSDLVSAVIQNEGIVSGGSGGTGGASATSNPIGDFVTGVANYLNPTGFLNSFFSLNTGERILAVILGAVLLVIALTILISHSKTVQNIIETTRQTATKVATTAAIAA